MVKCKQVQSLFCSIKEALGLSVNVCISNPSGWVRDHAWLLCREKEEGGEGKQGSSGAKSIFPHTPKTPGYIQDKEKAGFRFLSTR